MLSMKRLSRSKSMGRRCFWECVYRSCKRSDLALKSAGAISFACFLSVTQKTNHTQILCTPHDWYTCAQEYNAVGSNTESSSLISRDDMLLDSFRPATFLDTWMPMSALVRLTDCRQYMFVSITINIFRILQAAEFCMREQACTGTHWTSHWAYKTPICCMYSR